MKIQVDKSFEKDFRKLPVSIQQGVKDIIIQLKSVERFADMPNTKKLQGAKGFYRLKYKSYRIGVYSEKGAIVLSRVLHRKEIYKFFPKS